jgi:hypothetical protein
MRLRALFLALVACAGLAHAQAPAYVRPVVFVPYGADIKVQAKSEVMPLAWQWAPRSSGAFKVASLEADVTSMPKVDDWCGLWAFGDTDPEDFDLDDCGLFGYALSLHLDIELF